MSTLPSLEINFTTCRIAQLLVQEVIESVPQECETCLRWTGWSDHERVVGKRSFSERGKDYVQSKSIAIQHDICISLIVGCYRLHANGRIRAQATHVHRNMPQHDVIINDHFARFTHHGQDIYLVLFGRASRQVESFYVKQVVVVLAENDCEMRTSVYHETYQCLLPARSSDAEE